MTRTDPQERNDFQPTPNRSHPDAIEAGRDYEENEDEAQNRGDFTDPRVAQPGEDAPSDMGHGAPDPLANDRAESR